MTLLAVPVVFAVRPSFALAQLVVVAFELQIAESVSVGAFAAPWRGKNT